MIKLITLFSLLLTFLLVLSTSYAQTQAISPNPTGSIMVISDYAKDVKEGKNSLLNDTAAQNNQKDVKNNENIEGKEETEMVETVENIEPQEALEPQENIENDSEVNDSNNVQNDQKGNINDKTPTGVSEQKTGINETTKQK